MPDICHEMAPVYLVLSMLLAGEGDPPNLREICSSYDSHVQDIRSVECAYTFQHSTSPNEKISRQWERDGSKFLHIEHVAGAASSGLLHDGSAYYNLQIRKGRNENIQMMDSLADLFEWSILPETMLGTDVISTKKTLSELLRAPEPQLVGKERVGGIECWHISSAPFQSSGRGSGKNRVDAFLSPDHDYLPHRILVYKDGEDPTKLVKASWYLDMEVLEFGRFRDEREGIDRFFPAKARYRQKHPNEMTLQVTNCTINRNFGENHFKLRVPDGVEVLNVSGKPKPK